MWTEVASGISKLCYLREIFCQLGHQQTICLEVFCICKSPHTGQRKCTGFWKIKLAFGIFSTFNWGEMCAYKMQEHDSSYEKEAALLLELLLPSSSGTKKWKGGEYLSSVKQLSRKRWMLRPVASETTLARSLWHECLFFIDMIQITNFRQYESQNHLGDNLT